MIHNGEVFGRLTVIARATDMRYHWNSLNKRLRKWPLEAALTTEKLA